MSQIQLTTVINQLHEISGKSSYKYMLITQDDSHPNTELTFHYSPHFNASQIEELKLLLGRSSLTTIKPTLLDSFPITLTKRQSPNALLNQYRDLFNSLSQYICKDIAKAWIKILEPNKQALFPYRDYNKSKPDWWPPNVNHIEPDHLDKVGRVEVLINVLRHPTFDLKKVELNRYQDKPVLLSLLKEILYLALYERMFYNLLRQQDELFYLIPQHEQKLFDLDQIHIMTSDLKHKVKANEVVMASKITTSEMNSYIYGLNETNIKEDEKVEGDGGNDNDEDDDYGQKKTMLVRLRHRRGGRVVKPGYKRKETRASIKLQIAKIEQETKKRNMKNGVEESVGNMSNNGVAEAHANVASGAEAEGLNEKTQGVDRFEQYVDAEVKDDDTSTVERGAKDTDMEHSRTDFTQSVDVYKEVIVSKNSKVVKQRTAEDGGDKGPDRLSSQEEAKLGSPFNYNPGGATAYGIDYSTDEEYAENEEEAIEGDYSVRSVNQPHNHNRPIDAVSANKTYSMLKTPETGSNKCDINGGYTQDKSKNYQYLITPASSSDRIANLTSTPMTRSKYSNGVTKQAETEKAHIQKNKVNNERVKVQQYTPKTNNVVNYTTPYNNIIGQINCPPTPHPSFTLSTDHIKQDFLEFHSLPMLPMLPIMSDEFCNIKSNVTGVLGHIVSSDLSAGGYGNGNGGLESDMTDYVSDHSSYGDGSLADKSDDTDYDIIDHAVIDQCDLTSDDGDAEEVSLVDNNVNDIVNDGDFRCPEVVGACQTSVSGFYGGEVGAYCLSSNLGL
ncbi:hypothetical protein CANMA_003589 [Candida margitis]|uniref:uncharacterized protein n=1 Tax=Candida margitis TaxID=1775924 RepID=UPI00222746AD|nr:uncharacterized protein CANMA_003589 [Candida margitis]KAI5963992.1 hypothetical protein CANMA_003589 [Candida margitis]